MKFVLIMTICSALNHSCIQPQTINYFDTWNECALYGYQKSIDLLKELSEDIFEKQKSYTRFVCREQVQT